MNLEFNKEIAEYLEMRKAECECAAACKNICTGLENDSNSGERAIWELTQNARDINDHAQIKIELSDHNLVFSHQGKPFNFVTLRALVKQESSKSSYSENEAGRYGTGFMSTHVFNRKVYVSGPFVVELNDRITGHVQIKDFELDRTKVDTPEGPSIMGEQLQKVEKLYYEETIPKIRDPTTSFRYELTPEQVGVVSDELDKASHMIPFVLVINNRIREIEVINHPANKHFTVRRGNVRQQKELGREGWMLVAEEIEIVGCDNENDVSTCTCYSIQSAQGDVTIIPPYPKECGDIAKIPSLFLWFPLLGTESFGVNFIFHSKRFFPVEKRNNIMLPGESYMTRDKGQSNQRVMQDMMDVLFEYYSNEENAKALSREMCEVSFPQNVEDSVTQEFYNEMQTLWKSHIPDWKVLPVGTERFSVADPRVKLLHPDFYKNLTPEQKDAYSHTLAHYAGYPKHGEVPYLMPDADLVRWSETVARWNCNRDAEFFISISDVCQAIKSDDGNLHAFLQLMNDGGNGKVMEDYALLPNRNGELCCKDKLFHADFLTTDVFNLVSVLMGDDTKKILNADYHDVCKVSTYLKEDLQRAISGNMSNWREKTITSSNPVLLTDDELSALIKFCSSTCQSEFRCMRADIMPLVAEFFGKPYAVNHTIQFREEREEEFYSAAFSFLLEYTLLQVSTHHADAEWVKQNKDWLKRFLTAYAPGENEGRKNKLCTYAVLPNQKGVLMTSSKLHKRVGVPDLLVDFYQTVLSEDLLAGWVDSDFENLMSFEEDLPKPIAEKIQSQIVDEQKKEIPSKPESEKTEEDRMAEKTRKSMQAVIRDIILKLNEKDWQDWFEIINEKKAIYTFNMQSGEAQKCLFSIMDCEEDDLSRLAMLKEKVNIKDLLDSIQHQEELKRNQEALFHHRHAIGKHIEDVLRDRIGQNLVHVNNPTSIEDAQNGQDIVVCTKTKGNDGWKEVFYVEVKSKWDFSEPAHMSTRQIRKAALHPTEYALCCVDLRAYKHEDLQNLPASAIIGSTKVKMNIGHELEPMVRKILDADDSTSDTQIRIADYHSNMSAAVFETGESLDVLLSKIEAVVREKSGN